MLNLNFISLLENLVPISVASLSPSNLGSNSYILLLKSLEDSKVVFPIVIGPSEAQTISVFLENISIPRPLTCQLILSLLDEMNYKIKNVVITDFRDGIFYSTINIQNESNSFTLDARPSDSVAIAIKAGAPLFVINKLLTSVCIPNDELDLELEDLINSDESNQSIDELSNQLNAALEKEDYETAAKIRDQIEKRKL